MILKRLISKIKEIYYSSYIYYFYENYILKVPVVRMFIDLDYLGSRIKDSFLFKMMYKLCNGVLSKIPRLSFGIGALAIFFLIFAALFFSYSAFYIVWLLIIFYSFVHVLHNKNNTFFTVLILSFTFLFFLEIYGADIAAREAFVLMCCGLSFYLTFNTFKRVGKLQFLRFLHYLNITMCLTDIIFNTGILSGRVILNLLPFSLSYTVLAYKKIKRPVVFTFVILIAVLSGIGEGIILSCIAVEVILFCALYNFKYILAAIIFTPAAIAALVNRIAFLHKKFVFSGVTLNNVISIIHRYINNGLKGDVSLFSKTITQDTFLQLSSISYAEQLFVYSVLIGALIIALFLGRYIFRLIRKTLFLYGEKSVRVKSMVTGAISFFAGTSFAALFLPLIESGSIMLLYWLLLGFIKTLQKQKV